MLVLRCNTAQCARTKPRQTYRFSSSSGFLFGNLLDSPLDLGDIDGLVVDLDDVAENRSHLGEFVLVAGNEVEFGERHGQRVGGSLDLFENLLMNAFGV